MPGFPARPANDRFLEKFEQRGPDECWIWTATLDGKGYGQFMVYRRGRKEVKYARAHRYAYELFVGPIPEGLVIDHLCRNRTCVNPAHLEPVSNRENVMRGFDVKLGGSPYPCGHPRTAENSYYRSGRNPHCRQCALERSRKERQRKKQCL